MSLVPYMERNVNSCYNCIHGFASTTIIGSGEQSCLRLYDSDKKPTKKQVRKIKKALLRIKQGKYPPKCKLYKRFRGVVKGTIPSISQKALDFIESRNEISTDE